MGGGGVEGREREEEGGDIDGEKDEGRVIDMQRGRHRERGT